VNMIHENYSAKGLKVISMGRDWDLPPFITCEDWANMGATNLIVDDELSDFFPLFGGPVYPINVVINRDGVIIYARFGLFEDELIELFDSTLEPTSIDMPDHKSTVPESIRLLISYPNPFNPSTMISYELASVVHTTLTIYDVTGQTIKILINSTQGPGLHEVVWDGRNQAGEHMTTGVYFARLQGGDFSKNIKMLYLK
jgi:hypothetical protein